MESLLPCTARFLLLKKYGQILPEKTQYLFSAAPGRWSNLKTKVSLAKQRLGPRIQEESASISQDLETFAQQVLALQRDLENSDVYNRECSISEAYLIIDNYSKRLLVLENEAQDLIELQELLEANVVDFSILPTCRHELNNLKQVWETVRVIDEQQSEWKRHRWQKMNTKFLREETNKQLEIVKGLPDDVLTWDVYMGLHESITTIQRAVKDLAIEMSLKTYEEVWLSKIFELRSHTRTKVASADVTQDPGYLMLLTNTDPIFEELEHHQVTLQAMQSNSAAGSFLDEVLKWQKKLQTIEAVMTTWLEVQDKWVELEEVYTGADVKTALHHDANRFAMVNKDFRLLMRATERNPNVLQCCSRKNILKILEHMNNSLELCRRSLLNHLERRRQIFPRFYFLSMEDVLHIVCNGYDLNQVNLYISKLFEHLGSLVFEEVDENEKCSFIITGVDSALGERLHFQQPVACEGQIETWLTTFLNQLKTELQLQLATAMGVEKPLTRPQIKENQRKASEAAKSSSAQKKGQASAREGDQDSLLEVPGARSMTSVAKASTQDLTAEEMRTPPPDETSTPRAPGSDVDKASQAAPVDTMNISLPVLKEAEDVADGDDRKGDLEDEGQAELKLMLFPSQIQKLTSLIAYLSHLRDLLQRLIEMSPRQSPGMSFDWRSQLLYSFSEENRSVTVTCMKTEFEYGFEYLGSSTREVITPQTERMFVTMTQAVRAHTGVLCVGPKECGKFSHVRDLSMCLGRPLYLFNCTGATNYLQIQDIFRGLASTGCWVSFTDIANLKLPVLSVFAQLMATIMDALRQNKAAVHLQSD
nr:hypothetical protein BaRGS_025622 [Batillaria attramentaria]